MWNLNRPHITDTVPTRCYHLLPPDRSAPTEEFCSHRGAARRTDNSVVLTLENTSS